MHACVCVHLASATRDAVHLDLRHTLELMRRPIFSHPQNPQDANRDNEAAVQLPARLVHTAMHSLPTPLLIWLLHVITSKVLPQDLAPFVTSGTVGQPWGTGHGPEQGACRGREGSSRSTAGLRLDPGKAKRVMQGMYFGRQGGAGVVQAGVLPLVSAAAVGTTLMGVALIAMALQRHPVALAALVMAWEELAGGQQQTEEGGEGLGSLAGAAAGGPALTQAERVLLAAIQWEGRRRMQQRQQQQQQQREGAGWMRSGGGDAGQQGAGTGEAGQGQEPGQRQQQQQQRGEGEGGGEEAVAREGRGSVAEQLRRMEQQNVDVWNEAAAHGLPATRQSAGPASAADAEGAAMHLRMAELLCEQLEPLYGPGSVAGVVLSEAAGLLAEVAAKPHGPVLLGGVGLREDPVFTAVSAELEAASVRVTEQLLPHTPVGVLLHGAWWANDGDQAHRIAVTDRWCKEGQGAGGAAGRGRQRRRLLNQARSWEVAAADVGEAVEVLRPGLLRDPVSGPAWRLAVVMANGADEAEWPYVLVRLLESACLMVLTLPCTCTPSLLVRGRQTGLGPSC